MGLTQYLKEHRTGSYYTLLILISFRSHNFLVAIRFNILKVLFTYLEYLQFQTLEQFDPVKPRQGSLHFLTRPETE